MKATEDELAYMHELYGMVANTPNGGLIPVNATLIRMVKAGLAAIANPPPRLIRLGVIDPDKYREMQRGNSRFIFLRPLSTPRKPGMNLYPVYGIEPNE